MGDFAAFLAILVIFGAPIAAWIIHRVLAHQERMAMIQNGFVPQPGVVPPPPGPIPGPGLGEPYPRGAYTGPIPPPYMPGDCSVPQNQLRRGITVTLIGLAILIGLSFIGSEHHRFGPWLIGGLVPTFVGIAQVINAILNGARFPSTAAGAATRFGPPPGAAQGTYQPPPQNPNDVPPASSGGYAGWRPGNTTEIPRPASPPDNR